MKSKDDSRLRLITGIAGILAAILAYFLVPGQEYPAAPAAAAVAIWMAVWWIFEVIPIPITSLIPLVAFPVLKVGTISQIGASYGASQIFLFMGGFMLAIALQRTGVHRRFALAILSRAGSRPSGVVIAFMATTAFMSMWISNTASVLVMLPIALSIIGEVKRAGATKPERRKFALALMLGIAYSADMGGMATLVGTPPNLVFDSTYRKFFEDAPQVGFLEWMAFGVPLAIVFITIGWLLLTRLLFPLPDRGLLPEGLTARLRAEMPPVNRDEILAASVFIVTALLWMTGKTIEFGDSFTFVGWRDWFGGALSEASDAVVAIASAAVLFLIPSARRPGRSLLTWKSVKKGMPWGILLLFGGGFALANGFALSGLTELIGQGFESMKGVPIILLVLLICLIITFLTEITSNTAITQVTLPILASAAIALHIDPRMLMIPATLTASCAFMMPVASPTQAIVFASGHVPIRQMVRAGIWFNFVGAMLVAVLFLTYGRWLFGI